MDHRIRYMNGFAIADDKMHLITDVDYIKRYLTGLKIPADREQALCSTREQELAVLLKYTNWVVDRCTWLREVEQSETAWHERFAVQKKNIAHLNGRAVPTWLELIGPDGEIVFRADPVDARLADVMINEICPGLYNPVWGIYRAGEVVGTVFLSR